VGADDTTMAALEGLFAGTGFDEIRTKTIDVSVDFAGFDDLWRSQTPPLHPMTKAIAGLPDCDRARLVELVRAEVPERADGRFVYSARAHAIKACAPKSA
jgi:hypothetical protein